ncbi:MAG: LOG family protein [Spirochaetota bacterium]
MKLERANLAYMDEEFLTSRQARPIRILSEYLNPERKLKELGINHTVVFFGSARIRPEDAHPLKESYDAAEELAYRIASWSKTIEDEGKRVYVCTGGGPGIMEAANKGARRAGEHSIGLNIALPFEQVPNQFISPDLNIEFHYFYMRKLWFLYHSKAIIVFPGGFGTLDELFETLTLIQTRKIQKPFLPVLLYNRSYWDKLINFDLMETNGLITPNERSIMRFFESPDEAMEYLVPAISELTEKYTVKNF